MNKIIIILALILAPFFSNAGFIIDPSSPNFMLSQVTVEFPETYAYTIVDCRVGSNVTIESLNPSNEAMIAACKGVWTDTITSAANYCGELSWPEPKRATYQFAKYGTNCDGQKLEGVTTFYDPVPLEDGNMKTCPPEGLEDYTYSVYDGEPSQDTLRGCAKPSELSLLDSCDSSSVDTVLNVQVTDSQACMPMSDGSVCEYQSVDIGGGNQVYELNLEGDCYSDPKPDISGNPQIGQEPTSGQCTNNGGLLACSADPDLVCNSTNSTMDGGVISSCNPDNASCGYVNGSFVCYDSDTDSDGLPDYDDPDIDGDGVPNDEDLDSDGDGQDDPISSGGGGSGGDTTVNVDVDLSGVESRLDQIKDEITKPLTRGDKGAFDMDAANTELQNAEQEYQTKFEQIKTDAKTLIGSIGDSAGSFSACYDIATIKGNKKQACTTEFEDEMQIIANAVLFIFTVLAGFIVLRGRTND
jgi:hypothetical protein